MDLEKYISSGILELYVAGLLTEKENLEVYENSEKYPEIKTEIIGIEKAILTLSSSVFPEIDVTKNFSYIKDRINSTDTPKIITLPKKNKNWSSNIGWAAAIIFAFGLVYMYNQNNQLKSTIEVTNQNNEVLEEQIFDAKTSLEKTEDLLNTIRDKNITVVALGGQQVSPDSYAKAYWNKEDDKVFIDARGLPEPPEGMVYQVWSLKLNPLTPTSLGTLDAFTQDDNKIFALANANESEAFGITLEPAGGSETPTLEQLYTLGAVSS